ncbi:flavin-containing monooxygenase [Gordonia sp. NPDC127522]|uniref:flavin-containing monooxygenase n=1 Tax=Gordonia sp. NPDC127522 TaxID=3345390 RepID=UPI00363F24BC
MTDCAPTQTPEIDLPALQEKYREERDKRLRSDGQEQYLVAEGAFEQFHRDDPYTAVVPRDALDDDVQVVILGGGWAGLLAGARLLEAGIKDFRIVEHAGDFGGVWYWNRYPGIQVDTDSYLYLPLLEETGYMPTEKYTHGDENFQHAQRIGKHYNLYERAVFSTLVTSLEWDEAIQRWRIGTNRDDDLRARFVIMAQGPFNKPKLPGIPGIETFDGHMFHSARWDYDYTGGDLHGGLHKLAGKKVAVIGTGSTGVQIIPHVARSADHLFVFQRTPSFVYERGDIPTDPAWADSVQPGWTEIRKRNFHKASFEAFDPGEEDLICDGWTEVARNLEATITATDSWQSLTPAEFMRLREIEDYRAMERVRGRVAEVVTDPQTAEALKPFYRFLCKRPCFSDSYLPTFNRENVSLIDVSNTKGVERITRRGIVAHGVEHEVDCIIFASGFEITTDLDRRLSIAPFTGRGGVSLYDHWAEGYRTLHGMTTSNFPNLFFTGFLQGGVTASITAVFDQQTSHIAAVLAEAIGSGVIAIEPTARAVDSWCQTIKDEAVDTTSFARECTPGFYNNEGSGNLRSHLGEPYGPGFYAFGDLLTEWRANGEMRGMEVRH